MNLATFELRLLPRTANGLILAVVAVIVATGNATFFARVLATYPPAGGNLPALLASLECVSLVTWFDEDTPLARILDCRPDVLVKGGDWPVEKIVGAPEVLAAGGRVLSIPLVENYSTTSLIKKIRRVN